MGCNVRKISIEEVEEAFDLVCVLEGYAVEQMVAENLTQEDLYHIRSLQKELEECSRGKDYLKYMVKNGEFHGFFVIKCGNQTLLETVFDMRQKIYRINEYIGLTLPQYIDLYIKDHRELISVISAGKPLEAGKIMRNHVQRSKTLFIEAIDGLRLTG